MVLQTVQRGTCIVVTNDDESAVADALENSSAVIALSATGMAFWNVAGSNPRDEENVPGMHGHFERFAKNAELFCVVFGSEVKNAPIYTTSTIGGYLKNLNGRVEVLWYKDSCYKAVTANAKGSITLSVKVDSGNGPNIYPKRPSSSHERSSSSSSLPRVDSFAGKVSEDIPTIVEPRSLSQYLISLSEGQVGDTIRARDPSGGVEALSLFDMLEEGLDKAPAETSVVILDKDETTLNDMQNLQDILLLKSFITINAMSLMYERRNNKPYDMSNKIEAAAQVRDMANALNDVISMSMRGFLTPTQLSSRLYDKHIAGAEVHAEILLFLFGSFGLPAMALSQVDSLLTNTNKKLSVNIEREATTLNHMVFMFTLEPVEGLNTVKLPVLHQLYLKVDQNSWKASAEKSGGEMTKFHFKMNVVHSSWEMNPGQMEEQRSKIEELLTKMSSANLDKISALASPTVVDVSSPANSASLQTAQRTLRLGQPIDTSLSPSIVTVGTSTWRSGLEDGRAARLEDQGVRLITIRNGVRGKPGGLHYDTNTENVRYLFQLGRRVVRMVRQLLPYGTLNNTMRGGEVKSNKPGADKDYGYINAAKRGRLNRLVEYMVDELISKLPSDYKDEPKETAADMMAVSTATRMVGAGCCVHIAHLVIGVLSTVADSVTACVVEHAADHFFVIISRPGTRWYVIDPWVGTSYICPLDKCWFAWNSIRTHWRIDIHSPCTLPYGISFSSHAIYQAYRVAKEKAGTAPEFANKVWERDSNLADGLKSDDCLLAAEPLEWGPTVNI